LVTIHVGKTPNDETFKVYEELLVLHSEYFAELLAQGKVNERIREAEAEVTVRNLSPSEAILHIKKAKHLSLLDIKAADFASFISWIYSGTTTTAVLSLDNEKGEASQYAALWVLGSKLSAPSFENYMVYRSFAH
jgi:hypothetical protein